jgi:plasmid stabilization system protein ParE
MTQCRFLPEARGELEKAFEHYEAEQEGLGFEFAVEVWRTVTRIQEFPSAWPKMTSRIRRCRTNRFPYGVVYHVAKDCILIIAVAHLHRRPRYWRNRSNLS